MQPMGAPHRPSPLILRRGGLGIAATVLIGAAACDQSGFMISNRTDHAQLVVRVESPDNPREVIVGTGGNEIGVGGDGCLDGPVVAYDPGGEELARLTEGACEGRVWVVDADGGRLEGG